MSNSELLEQDVKTLYQVIMQTPINCSIETSMEIKAAFERVCAAAHPVEEVTGN